MTDVRGARIVRMLQDPDLGGDVLLVGLVLAARVDFGLKVANVRELGVLAFPGMGEANAGWRARMAFKDDVRTYRGPRQFSQTCGAPMLRRDGLCGRNSTLSGYLTDWATGELVPHLACSRHQAWYWERKTAHEAVRPDVVPLPMANHGGLIAKHIPQFNWRKFWARLDPRWVEHPEVKPWPKPTLSLVLGGAS